MNGPEGEATTSPVLTTLSLDGVFDLLSNRRRRYALYHLHDRSDGVSTIPDVASAVCRFERMADDGAEPDESAIALSLAHVHLPKLEAVGVVEVDSRSETVRYWRQPSLDEWLEHAFHTELAE